MTQIASQEDVDKILKAFYLVYNTLGYGFLERVYQNALYFELIEQGFKCEVQKQINVSLIPQHYNLTLFISS